MPQKHDWADLSPIDEPSSDKVGWGDLSPVDEKKPKKGFIQGLMDLPESMYHQATEMSKKSAEHIKQGQYPAAFHDITSFVTDPFYNIPYILKNKLTPQQAKEEAGSQLLGLTGLPVHETQEAWSASDYPRLAGQALGAVALLGGPHYFGRGKSSAITPEIIKPESTGRLGLPPAPPETPRFIGGEFGTAEAGRQYPFDLGQTPDVFSGTVLPQEFGEITKVNPEVAAQYGGAQGHPLAFRDPNMYTGQEIPGVPQSPIQSQQPFVPDVMPEQSPIQPREQLNQELLKAQQQSHGELLNLLGPEFVPPEMTDAFNAIRSSQIMPSPEDVALNAVTRNQFGFEHPSEYTPDEITQLQEQFGTTPRAPIINRGEQPTSIEPEILPARNDIDVSNNPELKQALDEMYAAYGIPPEKNVTPGQSVKAKFLGYGQGPEGPQPMYNIEGGESHGSTVSAQKLADMGIEVPETPEFTPEMRVSGDELRRRALGQVKRPLEPPIEPFKKLPPEGPDEPLRSMETYGQEGPPALQREYRQGIADGTIDRGTSFRDYARYRYQQFEPELQPQQPTSNIPPELAEIGRTLSRTPIGKVKSPLERGLPPEDPYFKKPSEMRVPGPTGNVAVGGADERVLDILGTALYTRDRPATVAKELLQNSVDELKISGNKGPIRIAFRHNSRNPTTGDRSNSIVVKDFGRGMNAEDLYTIFTDVGKTGKGSESSASGGFGFAKAAPLLGGDYVTVKSVVLENGEKIEYSFEGDPKQLKNQKVGVSLNKQVMPPETPTGFMVETFFPGDKHLYRADKLVKETVENSPGLSGIETYSDYNSTDRYVNDFMSGKQSPYIEVTHLAGKEIPPVKDIIHTPGAQIDVHYELDNKERNIGKVVYLNKDLYTSSDNISYGLHPIPHVPEKIVFNIKSTVEEGTEGYPFGANREEINREVLGAVKEWTDNNIIGPAKARSSSELQYVFDKLAPAPGNKFVVLDSGERYTPEELNNVNRSPVMHGIADVMDNMLQELGDMFSGESTGETVKFGFQISESGKGGINIHSPNQSNKFAILANPFGAAEHVENPSQYAQRMVHIIMHEFTHNLERSEGGGYTWALSKVYSKFDLEKQVNAKRAIQQFVDGGQGNYVPEFQKLLSEYSESRRRPESIPDFLGRERESQWLTKPRQEGIVSHSEDYGKRTIGQPKGPLDIQQEPFFKKPGDKDRRKQQPSGNKPNPTGAIERLKQVLASAAPLREQQQQGYTAELGKRLAVMQGIKTPGMKGFKQQLGALKGELPKLAPEAGLEQGDVDTLIDSVTSSDRIGPWQKLNAKIGLVKLLSGKELPNRSEIQLLSRVFGPDMAGIIEMHAGVPLKLTREIVNLPKSYMAAIDLSAPFRQGIGLIHKREWRNNILPMIRMFGDTEFHQATMEAIGERPKYSLGQDAGLKLPGVDEITSREEAYASSMAETGSFIPKIKDPVTGELTVRKPQKLYQQTIGAGIAASNRAYTGFLNKLRSDVFDNLVDLAEKSGHKTTEIDGSPTQITRDVARFVNNATGRGDLGHFEKYADDLNTVFFSPRLIASRLQTLNPKYYAKLDPFVRKEAIKSLFAIAGAGLATSMLAKEIYDKMGKKTSIGINPLSADLGKTRLGRTRLDPYGGFQQYIVGAARFIAGQTDSQAKGLMAPTRWSIAEDFTANKLNPVVKLAYEIARSRINTQGERMDRFGKQMNIPWETEKLFIPMFVRDMYEVAQDDPDLIPLMAPAGTFGMGVQTYDEPKQQSSLRLRMR